MHLNTKLSYRRTNKILLLKSLCDNYLKHVIFKWYFPNSEFSFMTSPGFVFFPYKKNNCQNGPNITEKELDFPVYNVNITLN